MLYQSLQSDIKYIPLTLPEMAVMFVEIAATSEPFVWLLQWQVATQLYICLADELAGIV